MSIVLPNASSPERKGHEPAVRSATPPMRRPLIPLLLVILGTLCYFSGWILHYAPPGSVPLMPVFMASFWGPLLCTILLAIWWLAFGRASFSMRFVTLVLVASLCVNAMFAAEENTRFWIVSWGLPAALAVMTFTAWVLFYAPSWLRCGVAALFAVAAITPWILVRIEGVTGEFGMDASWRWSKTGEQRLAEYLKEIGINQADASPLAKLTEKDWPGFRGANRDGRAPAVDLNKLEQLWAHPVGLGWGSVSGVGDRIFTQEQRETEEVVACYDAKSGKPIWTHAEKVRFTEGVSGAGPRATPTFHEGNVYALGGTGMLVCLDASTGKKAWGIDTKEQLEVPQAVFGYACSPLVRNGKVYVHPGVKGPILAAFDAKTGTKLWQNGEQETESYSSPQWATLAGVDQVLIFGPKGLTSHDPETGSELWRFEWSADATAQPCVQPTLLGDDRVVIGGAQPGTGFRCVKVNHRRGEWSAELAWETTQVTPRFNDVVLHQGNLYGLDSGRLFCLDAENGELRWKTRKASFGTGQVMLVGDRLAVVAEKGFLMWFDADPKAAPRGEEVKALSDKTWNHPALIQGRLFVRNSKELMCFGTKE